MSTSPNKPKKTAGKPGIPAEFKTVSLDDLVGPHSLTAV